MALKAPAPKLPGLHVFDDWDLAELREYIAWTPFFRAWELAGTYPEILADAVVGESAPGLWKFPNATLQRVVPAHCLTPTAEPELLAGRPSHTSDTWPQSREQSSP